MQQEKLNRTRETKEKCLMDTEVTPEQFEGPFIAIVTPFDTHGKIDYEALRDYLAFLEEAGLVNIVTNGTTGEFASLTPSERTRILEFCRANFTGRIVNHVSDCCLETCLEYIRHGEELADATLVLPPFYYAQPPVEGVKTFFQAIIKQARKGVFLYNFPKHTQFQLSAEMLHELAANRNLLGVKDSGGVLEISQAFKTACERLLIYVGADKMTLRVLQNGLDGSVTGGGNPVPEYPLSIWKAYRNGDLPLARHFQASFDLWTDFRRSLNFEEIPVVKAGIAARIPGFPIRVRPPLIEASLEQVQKIREFLNGGRPLAP
jgi:dihydrodipicolinate synthase/N-acetylneuraminate lyase